MTEEEIVKNYCKNRCFTVPCKKLCDYVITFVDGARSRESEIEELKKQMRKMKCCRNCKHFNQFEIHCDLYANYECVNLDKWEIAE